MIVYVTASHCLQLRALFLSASFSRCVCVVVPCDCCRSSVLVCCVARSLLNTVECAAETFGTRCLSRLLLIRVDDSVSLIQGTGIVASVAWGGGDSSLLEMIHPNLIDYSLSLDCRSIWLGSGIAVYL